MESDYIENLEQRIVDLEESLNQQRESMIRLLDEVECTDQRVESLIVG